MNESDDTIVTNANFREGRPCWVHVCAKCRGVFRTNDREENYCDSCNDDIASYEDAYLRDLE